MPTVPLFGSPLDGPFKIRDDILNLVGERTRYGKKILGDIWRASALVHAPRQCTADEREPPRRAPESREQRTARDVE